MSDTNMKAFLFEGDHSVVNTLTHANSNFTSSSASSGISSVSNCVLNLGLKVPKVSGSWYLRELMSSSVVQSGGLYGPFRLTISL